MTTEGERLLPKSLVRALSHLRERIPAETVDRLWLFPLLEWERRETGVIVASCFRDEPDLRVVHTLEFRMSRSGGGAPDGAPFEVELEEEGVVPADRLPRIIAGVLRRFSGEHPGEPEEVEVGGDGERLDALVSAAEPPTD